MTNSRAGRELKAIIKLADETVNNSTTYQADDELILPLNASSWYIGTLVLYFISGTTPDFKLQFTVPTGATGKRSDGATGIPTNSAAIATAKESGMSMSGSNQCMTIHFSILTTNAGNLGLNWAQNTQDVSDTKVLLGSNMTVWKKSS